MNEISRFFRKFTILFKLALIGFLILLLLIPLSMVDSVLRDDWGDEPKQSRILLPPGVQPRLSPDQC